LDGGSADAIRRVAVQFRPAPPPPTGDQLVLSLRAWSRFNSKPVIVQPGRWVWVQSNFLMTDCGRLPLHRALVYNRAMTISYRVGGQVGRERIALRVTRIILSR
jgi:hypothetical protein